MKVKQFTGKDYQEAIQKAKAEMGSDAIIFQSREIKPKGWRRFFYPAIAEVTVVIDEDIKIDIDRIHQKAALTEEPIIYNKNTIFNNKKIADKVNLLSDEKDGGKNEKPPEDIAKGAVEEKTDAAVKSGVELPGAENADKENISRIPDLMKNFCNTLVANSVDTGVVDKIAAQIEAQLATQNIEDEEGINSFCLNYLRECLDVIQPIRINPKKKGNLFFLVGPTGVGKTTTIAKLAANMTFTNRKRVALITLDTFRVAAVEQLKTFAEIMDIPIGVGFNPSDLLREIERFSGSDVIFVDTAGRSPYNQEHMEELRQCVLLARPKEVILVLSATTSRVDLINNYKAFSDIGVDKIIFTKLDETVAWGQILNTVYEMKKPIAYITNGQNVPDDITVPDPAKLAAKLLLKEY